MLHKSVYYYYYYFFKFLFNYTPGSIDAWGYYYYYKCLQQLQIITDYPSVCV